MKISLCMIVKNEEKYIEMCLNNALPLVDEAIIVDTGSTDKTLEIIEKLSSEKIKVFNHKWSNSFAEARNASLKEASGDWILVLDADEKIIFNKEKLIEKLDLENHLAYNIPMYNFIDKNNMLFSNVMIRLFKNIEPSYEGEIHEQLMLQDKKILSDNTFDENTCKIFHYGYLVTTFKEKNKVKRNIDIIKQQLKKEPKVPFHWYNLGVMYMNEGKAKKALDAFLKSHRFTQNTRYTFHEDLVLRMAECMIFLGQNKKCKDFLEIAIKDEIINKKVDFHYCLGLAYKNLKKFKAAINSFNRCIDIGEQISGISKQGRGSFLPKIAIAEIYTDQNNISEAIIKYMEAIFDPNNFTKAGLDSLKNLLIKHNMNDVLEELESTLSQSNLNKQEIKSRINEYINSDSLDRAKDLIKEYQDSFKDDPDIYSMKSIIAIMERNFIEAEELIDDGLVFDKNNVDLLFNKAYLYQLQNKYNEAINFYNKALVITSEDEVKAEINMHIKELTEIMQQDTRTSNTYDNTIEITNYKRELEEHKALLKSKIKELMDKEGLIQTKTIIDEYLRIVPDDLEVILWKSQMLVKLI